MRGVHRTAGPALLTTSGSSPHARGPHRSARGMKTPPRIIPACAGSTQQRCGQACGNGDHPRMRGVHPAMQNWIICSAGSSPHARGPLTLNTNPKAETGIIPACAGSTVIGPGRGRRKWDHPRMRGVHVANSGLTLEI